MAKANTTIQSCFATGVVAPGVWNRTDWERHDAAMAIGLNGTVTPTGGFRKRPGTRFINECLHDDKTVTMITFEFSKDQVYLLEFGDYRMRFFQNGGVILNEDDSEYILETPYSAQEAAQCTFAQERDAMFFAHWDKPLKKLLRYGHNNWVWSDVFLDEDDEGNKRIGSPQVLSFMPGGNGHNGWEYAVTAYRIVDGTPQESIGYPSLVSDPDDTDWIGKVPQQTIDSCFAWEAKYKGQYGAEDGFPAVPEYLNVYRIPRDQSAPRTPAPTAQGIRVFGGANETWVEMLKQVYPSLHYLFCWHNPSTSTPSIAVGTWSFTNSAQTVVRDNIRYQYWSNKGSGSSLFQEWAPYVHDTSGDNTTIIQEIVRRHINNNQIAAEDGRYMKDVYQEIIRFVDSYNDAHGLIKEHNHIRWTAVDGADGYFVYRRPMEGEDRNFYRIAQLSKGETDLVDDITETIPGPETPIESSLSFTQPDDYPSLVTFFQQRLVLAATKNKPTTIFGSRTGIYTEFTINATDNSSGYEFKMASQQSNPLTAILPLYTLVVLTSGGDFISTVSGAMNASNVNFNQRSYNGSSSVRPIIVGDSAVYVPLNQRTIKAMSYSQEKDGFRHENLLFNAQHFTKDKKVVGLAYQRDPINLIWALLDDGTLLSCLYVPEQGFLAWTEQETAGRVKSINTVPNAEGSDELWMVVERTVDGLVRQYLEVLDDMRPYRETPNAANSFFVDCGLSGVFDSPVTVISGLDHLEGREVAILADLDVVGPQTVRGGTVTLEREASAVHIGLPYTTRLRTLDLEIMDGGTLRNTRRRLLCALAEVEDTRELWFSSNGGTPEELIVHEADEFGVPKLQNGDQKLDFRVSETGNTYLEFESSSPVPLTINSIVAEIAYGDI